MLQLFRKPHCCFEKKDSIKLKICSKVNRSNIFKIFGNMLTDLKLSLQFVSFIKHWCYISLFKPQGKNSDWMVKTWKKKVWKNACISFNDFLKECLYLDLLLANLNLKFISAFLFTCEKEKNRFLWRLAYVFYFENI